MTSDGKWRDVREREIEREGKERDRERETKGMWSLMKRCFAREIRWEMTRKGKDF